MFKNRIKFKIDRKGAVLAFVLIIFLVISIITSSIIFVFSSNLKLAKHQEDNLKGHYLALSGIDLTISTLLNPLYVEGGEDKTMIDKFKKDNTDVTMSDEIDIDGQKVEIVLEYDNAEEEILITSTAQVNPDFSKELSAKLEFKGRQYRIRWN